MCNNGRTNTQSGVSLRATLEQQGVPLFSEVSKESQLAFAFRVEWYANECYM
jgi:hypothetical protein